MLVLPRAREDEVVIWISRFDDVVSSRIDRSKTRKYAAAQTSVARA